MNKCDILDSWIMLEHLSEGEINTKDKSLFDFDGVVENNFHGLLDNKLKEKRFKKPEKSGIAIYFDIFNFEQVLEIIREKNNITKTEEEIKDCEKFGFALYFDNNLSLINDMTFFTASCYIRDNLKIPTREEFQLFEASKKIKIAQIFEESNSNPELFNKAILSTLKLLTSQIAITNCKYKVLKNVEADATNLHSFFIEDLELAKHITTTNLERYLHGSKSERINLDSKSDSKDFNTVAFEKILQPKNYPLSRFPSNTKYSLSLMQQVAVNLALGYDNNTIRSVNGPPGTGKTTLLKDIFAELIIRQAYEICGLSNKKIKGTKTTIYNENYSIGELPNIIADNGIVVASSNNGAVQNIVKELPLIKEIDTKLRDEIEKVDYFKDISNSTVSIEWIQQNNAVDSKKEKKIELKCKEITSWGLISLEGGKADNMNNIIANLSAMCESLDKYEADQSVYSDFLDQYNKIFKKRNDRQFFADEFSNNIFLKNNIAKFEVDYEKCREFKEAQLLNKRTEIENSIIEKEYIKTQFRDELIALDLHIEQLKQDISSEEKFYATLKEEEPSIFSKLFNKESVKIYKKNNSDTVTRINNLRQEYDSKRKERGLKSDNLQRITTEIDHQKSQLCQLKKDFDTWDSEQLLKKKELSAKLKVSAEVLSKYNYTPLDMTLPYEELQGTNPWFDEEYRIEQSRLFIAALKVRKQFLYENKSNLKAATIIWGKQKDYADRKNLIVAAWHWINLSIPIISSTLASFHRMCKYLDKNTIGYLFIDEGGQALPQASVGAILRSKHVMVVGDPAQIKPVLTVDSGILSFIRNIYNISDKYISSNASTQALVDSTSQYGYYKDSSDDSWIGIPLWVHRRCRYPMFTISNNISYNNLMVQGKKVYGRSDWYDVKGKAKDKYVEEQGEFLCKKIQELIDINPDISNKSAKDIVYVITPFTNVANQLAKKLDTIGFTRYDENHKPTNIGTIHTFQGKEASIVFMVLGGDKQSNGAARWAVSEPNMVNVAATRAKEEFYVIGDKQLYLSLGSSVASKTYECIITYNKTAHSSVKEVIKEDTLNSLKIGQSASDELKDFTSKGSRTFDHYKDESDIEYIGNISHHIFHRSNCKYVPRNPAKRISFISKEDALQNGYTPCSTCKP